MRYIPHTDQDIREMLKVSGCDKIEDLFRSIPEEARLKQKLDLPPAASEPELIKHIKELGSRNRSIGTELSFLGAGSYHHHIPAAVAEIAGRSEWVTPYTPYQPEISQGTLQAIFEYQTMICNLTCMDVANASHYDGATATVEAALLAINKTGKKNIAIAATLHPEYRATIKTMLAPKKETVSEVPFEGSGKIDIKALKEVMKEAAGLIVQTPNFFGVIEDMQEISDIVHASGALLIVAITEPVSLGIFHGPGRFGADIVTAEGQAFGGGLNYGGPYLGIFAVREKYLRSMPGRVVGRTLDREGRKGFVLTISTREQHIRREKATSNICSNEALMATTAAIYLSLIGKEGLKRLAEINLANAEYLKAGLKKLKGVSVPFSGPTFNEFVIKIDKKDVKSLCKTLLNKNIFAGVQLERWYPALKDHLLVCTTECHTKADLDKFIEALTPPL